jgi:DNA-3-methyladenine glycosylase I
MVETPKSRCGWVSADPVYVAYHDQEWGVPEWDDRALYEKLVLDSFQAGLSWLTILRKRDNFRRAFAGFDPVMIAGYGPADVARLMADAGIVRNRAKIEAAVAGARGWLDIVERKGSFAGFVWRIVEGRPRVNHWGSLDDVPAATAESQNLSKALREHGFRFVGPTVCYAFMQAVGMVNDHVLTCFRHAELSSSEVSSASGPPPNFRLASP